MAKQDLDTFLASQGVKSTDVLAHKDRTVQDIYDEMSDEHKDLVALIVGAAVTDEILDTSTLNAYDALTIEHKNFIDYVVGGAMSDASSINHAEIIDEAFLIHYGVKGMRWGVRKSAPLSNPLSGSSKNTPTSRATARDKVKVGNASLGEAHLAALKSTGHRITNGFLGDKKFWMTSLKVAGFTGAGLLASTVVPGLLPAGVLTSIGSAVTGGSVMGFSEFGGKLLRTEEIGRFTLQGLGYLAAYGAGGVAVVGAAATNVGRAVRGNARVDRSYSALGEQLAKRQNQGSQQVQKILNRNGSINKKFLKQNDAVVDEAFIAHYGVKGMKWGVRRSQAQLDRAENKVRTDEKDDGGTSSPSGGSSSSTPNISPDAERIVKASLRPDIELTDKEINDVLNRARIVKQYNELLNPPKADPNSELLARVNQLKLQRELGQLKAEMNPGQMIKVRRLIASAAKGYVAYAQINEATNNALSDRLAVALGQKPSYTPKHSLRTPTAPKTQSKKKKGKGDSSNPNRSQFDATVEQFVKDIDVRIKNN